MSNGKQFSSFFMYIEYQGMKNITQVHNQLFKYAK